MHERFFLSRREKSKIFLKPQRRERVARVSDRGLAARFCPHESGSISSAECAKESRADCVVLPGIRTEGRRQKKGRRGCVAQADGNPRKVRGCAVKAALRGAEINRLRCGRPMGGKNGRANSGFMRETCGPEHRVLAGRYFREQDALDSVVKFKSML